MHGIREVRAAEQAASVVFGVGVDAVRGTAGIEGRLAHGSAVTAAVDLHRESGLVWRESVDAFNAAGWAVSGATTLRAGRRRFAQLLDAGSEFSRSLARLHGQVLRHARLLLLTPSLAA